MDWESFANPIASGASGLFGLLGTIGTNIAQANQAKKNREFQAQQTQVQNDFNERMMNQQNEWSLQQWNRQNEYDSPAAKLQRVKDAGLNPLMVGADANGAAPLQSATAQSAGVPSGSMAQMENPVGSITQMIQAMTDAQVAKSQIDKNKAETEATQENTSQSRKTFEVRFKSLVAQLDLTGKQADQVVQQAQNLISSRKLTDAQAQLAYISLDIAQATKDNQIALSNLEVHNKQLEGDLMSQNIKNLQGELAIAFQKLDLEKVLTGANVKQLESAIRNADYDSIIKSLDLKVKRDTLEAVEAQIAAGSEREQKENKLVYPKVITNMICQLMTSSGVLINSIKGFGGTDAAAASWISSSTQ